MFIVLFHAYGHAFTLKTVSNKRIFIKDINSGLSKVQCENERYLHLNVIESRWPLENYRVSL